jgi:hypothetical protein
MFLTHAALYVDGQPFIIPRGGGVLWATGDEMDRRRAYRSRNGEGGQGVKSCCALRTGRGIPEIEWAGDVPGRAITKHRRTDPTFAAT